ncbi:hypothetical protein LUZ61_016396 [Rhynchospora tenuis]|uniref:O-methyltransferase n=1 Tax=Rhynchospora tenuis TaxID=198213 RepID=A0AAD5Z5F9_9POAL|nr:hypothetical protein LUZ61_016396 [Rhynchospora tenuis]
MNNNVFQAIAELWKLIFGFHKSMSLKCALDLGIPDAICNHGQPMTLSQLHSVLSLPLSRKPHLFRLMRILTEFGFILENDASSEVVYDLTPLSRLVTSTKVESLNLLPFTSFHLNDVMLKSSLCMGDWFMQEEKQMPFELAHGVRPWEMARQDPKLSKLFNDAIYGNGVAYGCRRRYRCNFKSDCSEFPPCQVHCFRSSSRDVEADFSNDGSSNVTFVPGDMFNHIPPADVVLLKWILHCWSDENCIKILRQCKQAIPSREAGGKVLILEAVVGSTSSMISKEPQLLFDLMMMSATEGVERDEQQWSELFSESGFSSYSIIHTIGFMSIIEV